MDPRARFPLAQRIQADGISLGEAFSFLSGLYFRGKLAYARQFGRPPAGAGRLEIITSNRGLLQEDTVVRADDLCAFGSVDIDGNDPRYRKPLARDAGRVAALDDGSVEVVLLGSIATAKYVDVLLEALGERLLFPPDFVGRGDMSRGALMLRAARDERELDYIPVAGAIRSTARARLTRKKS